VEDTDLSWRKSSYSGNGGATCVEVGKTDRVLVRDTQDRTGLVLRFNPAAWRRFASQVKRSLAELLPEPIETFRVSKVPLRRVWGRFLMARAVVGAVVP
jgi:hypothetical protein